MWFILWLRVEGVIKLLKAALLPHFSFLYFLMKLQVGHGETVTVRVPTHCDGNALFWEFATDGYDVAFGLFFEWTNTDEKEISVHISDSEDEDLDDEGTFHSST